MPDRSIVLCSPCRTPICGFGGSLKDTAATDLGAIAVQDTLKRSGIGGDDVSSVYMGQVIQAGAKMNGARQAAIKGGLPDRVPAMTVNRVCGSGAQAVVSAAQDILLGNGDCAVAGGMENMDQGPYLLLQGRWGYRLGKSDVHDATLRDGLLDAFSDEHSGWHTEDLAKKYEVSRKVQDEWAARSQQRFADAQNAGKFDAEIVPVDTGGKPGRVEADDANRPSTTLEGLSKLKPAFRKDGTITAGNAPGINTGASAMLVADAEWAEKKGLQPMARLVSHAVSAVDPGMFGIAPVSAVQRATERAGWNIDDVERFEINEAFAAIAVAVTRELGLDDERVNVDGGAIAHGHPIGATGAVLTTRLLYSMKRDGLKRGVVTLCIGGGQGIALAVESLS